MIDASAAIELVLAGRIGKEVAGLIEEERRLAAPEVIDLEFLQSMRGLLRAGKIDGQRADLAILDFDDLPVRRHRHRHLRRRIWKLRHDISAYDAAYVALAEWLDSRLITADARLARAVTGLGLDVRCELVR